MEQLTTSESSDFRRAKELAQKQEDWLEEKFRSGWDHHDLLSQIKVFLYALTDSNFYHLSLAEDEFDFIADGLFDFVNELE